MKTYDYEQELKALYVEFDQKMSQPLSDLTAAGFCMEDAAAAREGQEFRGDQIAMFNIGREAAEEVFFSKKRKLDGGIIIQNF
jgi:hypothetical protein